MICRKIIRFSLYNRLFSTQTKTHNEKLEPVNMAYASYESTDIENSTPPVVVMHGLFGNKGNWNSLCKAIQKNTTPNRKIFAVDARNHGDSPHTSGHSYPLLSEDIKSFLTLKRIPKASLIGHSMGGRAVMYFALTYPDAVDKLIVVDMSPVSTSPSIGTAPALFDIIMQIKLPKSGPMSAARSNVDAQLLKEINNKGLRAFLLTNLVQKENGSYSWRMNLKSLHKNFPANMYAFPSVGGATYNKPTLFIGGANSDHIKKTDHPKILEMFPKAQFEYIPDAGHWVHSERPNEFLKIALNFLNS